VDVLKTATEPMTTHLRYEHYQRMVSLITDQTTLDALITDQTTPDGIKELIARMKVQKALLHPEQEE
jgi:hypothetical protein